MTDKIKLVNYIDNLKPTLAGKFLFNFLPFRKKIVLGNMHRVFKGSLSEVQINHLAKCFYSHIATSIKENLVMRFMSEKAIRAKANVVGHEKVIEVAKANKGVIVLTGHFGNWEFAPIAGILNFKEFQNRFYFIRKTLGVKFLERLLFKRYYNAGLKVIPKKNSLNKVCDALEKNSAVVFVMDQHASLGAKDGIAVEFFGEKAGTYRSLATIARYTNVPVVPAHTYRDPNGKHVLKFLKPIEFKEEKTREETLYANTLNYNQALEKIILERPEQWLWMHRRWKLS